MYKKEYHDHDIGLHMIKNDKVLAYIKRFFSQVVLLPPDRLSYSIKITSNISLHCLSCIFLFYLFFYFSQEEFNLLSLICLV